MQLSEVNYCLQNNLEIDFRFPEYNPIYPVLRNGYYNVENLNKNEKYIQDFCRVGSNYDIEVNPGLSWCVYVYPYGDSRRLENMIKLASVLFCIDDNFEKANGLGGRDVHKAKLLSESLCELIDNISDIKHISIYELQNWKPFMFALYVSMYQIYLETGDTFWLHFKAGLKTYINSCAKECEIEVGTYKLNESELLQFRVGNSCGYAWIMLIQYSENFELTEDEINNQLLQTTIEFAIKSLIMCNDLYSFHIDIHETKGNLEKSKNMIAVLMKSQNLTLEVAVNKLINIITNLDKSYAYSKKKVLDANPSENVKRFCNRIDYMLGGNWMCHLTAKRYTDSNISGISNITSPNIPT